MNQQEQAEEGYTEDYAEGEDPDADDEVEEDEPPKPAQTSQPMVSEAMKLNSFSHAKCVFFLLQRSIFFQTPPLPLSNETLMQSVFRQSIESCVMSMKCSRR